MGPSDDGGACVEGRGGGLAGVEGEEEGVDADEIVGVDTEGRGGADVGSFSTTGVVAGFCGVALPEFTVNFRSIGELVEVCAASDEGCSFGFVDSARLTGEGVPGFDVDKF